MKLNKQQFVDNFVTTFISTWCADNYEECSLRGYDIIKNAPIEDAEYIAEQIWERHYAN